MCQKCAPRGVVLKCTYSSLGFAICLCPIHDEKHMREIGEEGETITCNERKNLIHS